MIVIITYNPHNYYYTVTLFSCSNCMCCVQINMLENEIELEHKKYVDMKESYDALVNELGEI